MQGRRRAAWDWRWMGSLLVLTAASWAVGADERPTRRAGETPAAAEPRTYAPSAEQVARELYELQESQGGSVLQEFGVEQFGVELSEPPMPRQPRAVDPNPPARGRPPRHWFQLNRPESQRPVAWDAVASDAPAVLNDGAANAGPASDAVSQTVLLRRSAWKLEQVAHRLEMSELFAEADAVREIAQRLRTEARRPRLSP